MNNNIKSTSMDMRFEFHIIEIQGHKVLVVSGDIDVYSAPQFKQGLMSILDGTEQHLIIDMHNVRYMDSSGLGILVSAMKRLSPNGGTINLVGCQPSIEQILYLTQLSSIIAVHQNMDDAMEAISAVVSGDFEKNVDTGVAEGHSSEEKLETPYI